jgi:hypothetical protein
MVALYYLLLFSCNCRALHSAHDRGFFNIISALSATIDTHVPRAGASGIGVTAFTTVGAGIVAFFVTRLTGVVLVVVLFFGAICFC